MKISKRLKAISNLVPENSKILDIGCDHGLLDIYLAKNKNVKCVVSDNKQICLDNAIFNIKKYNLSDKISPVLSEGLKNIDITDIDIVIISGMGTKTILDILNGYNINHLIIQSNNNLFELRKEMVKKGYIIKNEIAVLDYKYYVVIEFKKDIQKYSNFELSFGPILLKNNNKNYYKSIYKKLIFIESKNKNILKKILLKYYLFKLKKYC